MDDKGGPRPPLLRLGAGASWLMSSGARHRDASIFARRSTHRLSISIDKRVQFAADAKMFARDDRLFIAVPLTLIHCGFELHWRNLRRRSRTPTNSELIFG
jgi:hypothetical protein